MKHDMTVGMTTLNGLVSISFFFFQFFIPYVSSNTLDQDLGVTLFLRRIISHQRLRDGLEKKLLCISLQTRPAIPFKVELVRFQCM